MRLPRPVRSPLSFLILAGVFLHFARDDDVEAVQDSNEDLPDELCPVMLVQTTWNLLRTRTSTLVSRPSKGKGWDLSFLEKTSLYRGLATGLQTTWNRPDSVIIILIVLAVVLFVVIVIGLMLGNMTSTAPPAQQLQESTSHGLSRQSSGGGAAGESDVGSGRDVDDLQYMGNLVLFHSEGTEEEAPEIDDIDLQEDIYSTALQGILSDGIALVQGEPRKNSTMGDHRFRLIFVLVLLLANYVLQFGVLYFVAIYVVTPATVSVQSVYRQFHRNCFFATGDWNEAGCQSFQGLSNLCGLIFTYTWFMVSILMIWTMTMVREIRSIERLARALWNIESTSRFESIIEFHRGVEHVTHLTPWLRFFLFLVVAAPRLAITSLLGILGTVWLSSTPDLPDVILNAVALEFIIQIEELMFGAVMPHTFKESLSKFRLTVKARASAGAFTVDAWRGYVTSFMYLLMIVAVPLLYVTVGQRIPFISILPDYDRQEVDRVCIPFLQNQSTRICVWNSACFPYGR